MYCYIYILRCLKYDNNTSLVSNQPVDGSEKKTKKKTELIDDLKFYFTKKNKKASIGRLNT